MNRYSSGLSGHLPERAGDPQAWLARVLIEIDAQPLGLSAPCQNPECGRPVDYGGTGRPPLYCSHTCRGRPAATTAGAGTRPTWQARPAGWAVDGHARWAGGGSPLPTGVAIHPRSAVAGSTSVKVQRAARGVGGDGGVGEPHVVSVRRLPGRAASSEPRPVSDRLRLRGALGHSTIAGVDRSRDRRDREARGPRASDWALALALLVTGGAVAVRVLGGAGLSQPVQGPRPATIHAGSDPGLDDPRVCRPVVRGRLSVPGPML